MCRSWSEVVWSAVDDDICVGCISANSSTSARGAHADSVHHHTSHVLHRTRANAYTPRLTKRTCYTDC